jgi:hypothetical protein
MGDDSGEETRVNEDEKKFEDEINKEISKLKYFLEEADELIENRDYAEMDILDKRAGKIINKLTNIIAQTEELKLDNGTTPRAVRQWKKDVRTKYIYRWLRTKRNYHRKSNVDKRIYSENLSNGKRN